MAYSLFSVFMAIALICLPVSATSSISEQTTTKSEALTKNDQINNVLTSGELTEDIKSLIDYDETRKIQMMV